MPPLHERRAPDGSAGPNELSDRCGRTTGGPPRTLARWPASVRSVWSLSPPFDRSPVRPAFSGVAAQSLVGYVRLAALCGLVRCEIAESPKGNRRRRLITALAAGARVGKLRDGGDWSLAGIRIPRSGPVAKGHVRPTDCHIQGILRTVRRTIRSLELRSECGSPCLPLSQTQTVSRTRGALDSPSRCRREKHLEALGHAPAIGA